MEDLKSTSIKQHYRIIVDFDLDVPNASYKIVEHEYNGLAKDLCAYSIKCQRLTIYSRDHPRIGRFRRRPENVVAHFDRTDEYLDYMI